MRLLNQASLYDFDYLRLARQMNNYVELALLKSITIHENDNYTNSDMFTVCDIT